MINYLEMRRWCQHDHRRIDFRAGLNGILGRNGEGKSNLIDALRFVDTGESHNSGKLDKNIMWGSDSCWVEAGYTVGSTEFTLKRTIRATGSNTVQMKIKGGATLDKKAEVADELDRIYASNKEARLQNVYIPQGELDAIIFAAPADRYAEFQKTFSMGNLQKAHDWLKIEVTAHQLTPDLALRLSEAVTVLEQSRAASDLLASQRQTLTAAVDDLASCEAVLKLALEATRTQQAIAYATAQLKARSSEVASAAEALTAAELQEAQARAAVDQMRDAATQAQADVTATEQAVVAYKHAQRFRQTLVEQEAALAALAAKPSPADREAKAAAMTAASAEVQRIIALLANPPKLPQEIELEEFRASAKVELATLLASPVPAEIIKVDQSIANAKKHLALVEQGKCPTCGATFSHDPATLLAEFRDLERTATELREKYAASRAATNARLTSEIREAETMLQGFRVAATEAFSSAKQASAGLHATMTKELQAVDALIASHDRLENQILQTKAALGTSSATEPDISKLELQRQFVASFAGAELQIHSHASQVAGLRASAKAAQTALTQAQASLDALGQAADAPSPAAIAKAQADADTLKVKRQELTEVLQQIGINQALVGQRESEVTRLREKLIREERMAKWVEEVKVARDALHVTALPALAMREFAKILNVRMEHYLTLWESKFRMWLDDDMAFQVEFEGGNTCDARRLSGGQKMFASTSFRLAMSDTFASSVGLLVLDEPAAYLDPINISHLQTLLLRLKETSAKTGRQILIVNHGEQLTGFLDHVIQL
jgi:DNA repair exonuclease SbcCD ATPase subunit